MTSPRGADHAPHRVAHANGRGACGGVEETVMQALPGYDDFKRVVGSRFTVAAVVDEATDQLVEVDLRLHAISEQVRVKGAESWTLEFRGPAEWAFEQGMASLDHARFGRIDLFIVPLGPRDDEMAYEAVFSMLTGT
jgi:hypothetical protein